MFKAFVEDAKNLKYIIDSISELADEVFFSINKDELIMEACDPSLVCKVELTLLREFFKEFSTKKDLTFWVDLNTLSKISKRIKLGDSLRIDVLENSFGVVLKSLVERRFESALLEGLEESLPIIDTKYETSIEMDSTTFREGIRDVAIIGNTAIFELDEKELKITSEGETGKVRIIIEKENQSVKSFKVKKPCSARFNLSYLMSFLRSSYISDSVFISLKEENLPLKLELPLESGSLIFYLAPMEI